MRRPSNETPGCRSIITEGVDVAGDGMRQCGDAKTRYPCTLDGVRVEKKGEESEQEGKKATSFRKFENLRSAQPRISWRLEEKYKLYTTTCASTYLEGRKNRYEHTTLVDVVIYMIKLYKSTCKL